MGITTCIQHNPINTETHFLQFIDDLAFNIRQPGRDLLVADQPVDMIESIHTLLMSQPDRERFGHAARHMAEIWYDWSRCLWPLEPLYQNLLSPKAVAC